MPSSCRLCYWLSVLVETITEKKRREAWIKAIRQREVDSKQVLFFVHTHIAY